MRTEPLLEIRNLAAGYATPIFQDVDLTIEARQFVTIMGENGSGKTTLLDCLMGFKTPTWGEALFWGEKNEAAARKPIQERVGWVVSQPEAFPPWLRVKDIIGSISPLYPSWDDELYRRLAVRLQLDTNKRIGHLSMGEGSKFRLIKAIAFQPELLILDELTANLSPDSKKAIIEVLLDRFASCEMSVLYVCHSSDEAIRLSDQIFDLTPSGLVQRQGGNV